jgi:hypothetical protein
MNDRLERDEHQRVQRAAAQAIADQDGRAVECQGATFTPRRHGACTVPYRGRPAPARHAELLPNGGWRVDFTSGLVGMYDADPVLNPHARQLH